MSLPCRRADETTTKLALAFDHTDVAVPADEELRAFPPRLAELAKIKIDEDRVGQLRKTTEFMCLPEPRCKRVLNIKRYASPVAVSAEGCQMP